MVNFIIRDGDKFVLNGNELMRTENPVLEVPDIVGSEDITEKIAQDVQEGDMLFKYQRPFIYPKAHKPWLSRWAKFFIYKNQLHAVAVTNQASNYIFYRYDDGEWVTIFGDSPASDQLTGTPTLNHNQYGQFDSTKVKVIDDTIYLVGGENNGRKETLGVYKIEGNRYRRISGPYFYSHDHDVSSTTNAFAYGVAGTMAKIGDTIHVAGGGTAGAYGVNLEGADSFITGTFDPIEERYTQTGHDTSGYLNTVYSMDMVEYEGSGFLAVGFHRDSTGPYTGSLSIFKWNSITSNWDLLTDSLGPPAGNPSGRADTLTCTFEILNGSLYLNAAHFYSYTRIFKFDSASGEFKPLNLTSNADGGGGVAAYYYINKLFYHNGGLKLLANSNPIYNTDASWPLSSVAMYCNVDEAASSIDLLTPVSGYAYYVRPTHPTTIDGLLNLDAVDFNGELHILLCNDTPETLNFYKYDSSTSSFKSSIDWTCANGGNGLHRFSGYTFSGQEFISQAHAGNPPRVHQWLYHSATDSFTPLRSTDIEETQTPYVQEFYETDGVLYLMTINVSKQPRLYQYEASANQFLKLADPDITASSGGQTTQLDKVVVSGMTYLFSPLNGGNHRDWWLVAASGSNWDVIEPPSSITTNSRGGCMGYYDGSLFIFINEVYSNTAKWAFRYDLATSTYTELGFSGTYYDDISNYGYQNRHSFIEADGEFYLLPNYRTGIGAGKMLRYDAPTEQFVEVNYSYIHPGGSNSVTINHDGTPYIFFNGYTQYSIPKALAKYDGSGVWKHYAMDFYSDDLAYGGRPVSMWSHNGVLDCVWGATNIRPHALRATFNAEFADEEVWYTDKSPDYRNDNMLGVGIALESGSKGDTIKIRKVKR